MLKRKKLALLVIAILLFIAIPTVIIANQGTNTDSLMIQSLLINQQTKIQQISAKDGGNPLLDAGNTIATAMVINPGIYTDCSIDWLLDPDDFYNVSVPATGYTINVSIDCYLDEGATNEYLLIGLYNPNGILVTQNIDPNIDIGKNISYTLKSTDKTGYWTIQINAPWPSGGTYTLRVNVSDYDGSTIETAMIITPGIYTDCSIDWLLDQNDFYNISVPATGYTIYASIDCQLTNGTYPGGLVFMLFNPDGMLVAQYVEPYTYLRRGLVYTLNSTDKTGYWTIGVYAPGASYLGPWDDWYSSGSYTLRVNVSASQSMTKPEAQWTYMSYMVAEDPNCIFGIGPFSMNDIAEMAGVGSTGSVNIVSLVDYYAGSMFPEFIPPYTSQNGTRVYYIDHEGVIWLSDFGDAEKNTGSYETLRDFISFVKTHFPAQHYALNLWNHGAGIYGVCFDATDASDNLNFTEIFQALNETGGVDLLHYKACLTGIIEDLYSVANLTDVIVASEDSTVDPSQLGFSDFYFLSSLSSNPSASATELGQWIVDSYSVCDPPLLSFAVVDSSKIADVYAALNETAKYLDIQILNSTWRTTIIQTLNQVENFTYYIPSAGTGYFLVDLYDFADKLAQNLNDARLTTLTNNLKTAIQNAVIYLAHGADHPNAHGIAIYHPNTEGNYSRDNYTTLLFATNSMWDEYLWHLLGHHTEHDTLDYDGDGLVNSQEYNLGTNAFNNDTDGDGMPDGWEVANSLNPLVNDSAGDPDNDNLTNLQEYNLGTNPQSNDTDGDGMPDGWEVANSLNPLVNDSSGDPDDDNLDNFQEYSQGTNPQSSDSEGDGMPDDWEVANSLNPLANDTTGDPDNDNLTNLQEYLLGTNPQSSDSEGDGMPDGWEVQYELDPLADDAALDADNDTLTNIQECNLGTNPQSSDSEGDGMPDGWEVQYGLDPISNDANQDKDGDGFTNLQEYLAGTDPTDASSRPPTPISETFAMMAVILVLSTQQPTQQLAIVIILIVAVIAVAGIFLGLKFLKR